MNEVETNQVIAAALKQLERAKPLIQDLWPNPDDLAKYLERMVELCIASGKRDLGMIFVLATTALTIASAIEDKHDVRITVIDRKTRE